VSKDHGDITEPNVPGEAWIKSRTSCFFYWRKNTTSRGRTFIGEWTRTGRQSLFRRRRLLLVLRSRQRHVQGQGPVGGGRSRSRRAHPGHPACARRRWCRVRTPMASPSRWPMWCCAKAFRAATRWWCELWPRARPLGGYKGAGALRLHRRAAAHDLAPRSTARAARALWPTTVDHFDFFLPDLALAELVLPRRPRCAIGAIKAPRSRRPVRNTRCEFASRNVQRVVAEGRRIWHSNVNGAAKRRPRGVLGHAASSNPMERIALAATSRRPWLRHRPRRLVSG